MSFLVKSNYKVMPRRKKETPSERSLRKFYQKIYLWMFAGLMVSGITAYFIASNPLIGLFVILITALPILWMYVKIAILSLGDLSYGINLSFIAKEMEPKYLKLFFIAHSFFIGALVSEIFLFYRIQTVYLAFIATAIMFIFTSAYLGLFRKNPLSPKSLFSMALIGIFLVILMGLLQGFSLNPGIEYSLSFGAIILFTIFTAAYASIIEKTSYFEGDMEDDKEKQALAGALEINLFYVIVFLLVLRALKER
jgi:uncharacterized protein